MRPGGPLGSTGRKYDEGHQPLMPRADSDAASANQGAGQSSRGWQSRRLPGKELPPAADVDAEWCASRVRGDWEGGLAAGASAHRGDGEGIAEEVPVGGAAAHAPALPGHILGQLIGDEQPVLLRFGGGCARWQEDRARHRAPGKGKGVGGTSGSREARRLCRTFTMVCLKPGCEALVNRARARQLAHQAGQVAYTPGVGCASPSCAAKCRRARFIESQKRVTDELLQGSRWLVCWPEGPGDSSAWKRDANAVQLAVGRALAAVARLEDEARAA
jgi:hypothetical protein